MTYLLQKAKQIFPGTKVKIVDICSVDSCTCRSCYKECSLRIMSVVSVHRNRQIGWFEGGNLIKTNPKPTKRYKKRILGLTKESSRRPRKHWLSKFQTDTKEQRRKDR